MQSVKPKVYLINSPNIKWKNLLAYLEDVDGLEWIDDVVLVNNKPSWNPAQKLVEFAGRLCYRSWKPGLNPNVKKVRKDSPAYLMHILESKHGSVLEHANFTFVFHNVSRVFTHELVRHRVGVAISQESMRFVRLNEIPFWMPEWAEDDDILTEECQQVLNVLQHHQQWLADYFKLDKPNISFQEKKEKTSFMRRFLPEGVTTDIVWTANIRILRHVIEVRTAPAAEEEIRLVFGEVAKAMKEECPELFGDFIPVPIPKHDGEFMWVPEWSKV